MKFFKIVTFNILFFLITNNISFSEIINNVKIKGNRQINLETVLNKIEFKKGNDYSLSQLNLLQKKLFDTGFFQSIKFDIEADTLLIKVIENPVVDFFYIYGDKNKDRIDKIYDILNLKSGNLFSDYKLLNDIEKISELYKYDGYYNVKVEPTVKKINDAKVNISLKIIKNKKFKIKNIYFIGEKFFKASELLDVVSSSEDSWLKFLSTSSLLNEKRIEYDKRLLKLFYLDFGFYDAQVISSKIDISDNGYADIIFSIDSGKRYYFGNFTLNNSNFFNNSQIQNLNKILKKINDNNVYSAKLILNIKEKINEFLISNKYSNFEFNVRESKESNKINIIIDFYEKKLPTVKNILVKGNSITEEKVIRNNLTFSEGDALTNFKINKSEDNLNAIGIFKNSKINKKSLDNNLVDIEVNVEEQPTGSIMGGVGIGSNETAISFSINEKNFLGSNIGVNTEMSIGTEKIIGNFLIINPDFKDSGRLIKNNFYAQSTNYDSVGYESSMVGNDISTSYLIYEGVNLNLGMGFDYDKIQTSSSASSIYKSQEGNYKTFKAFYGLSNDERDKKFNTTKGHVIGFNQSLAIPGSDIPFILNNIYGRYYHSFSKDYLINFKSGLTSISGYTNKDVKLSNRLFLSTKQLRGFEPRSVGPVDGVDHVGGNYSFYSGLSSTFPNPFPEKWNAKTIVFYDIGNVWGVDYDSSKDSNKIRSSIGLGLDWMSPLGPVTLSLSNSISKADTDKDQSFSFQIGSTF